MTKKDDIDLVELTRRQRRRFGLTAFVWKTGDMERHRLAARAVAMTVVGVLGITLVTPADTAGAAKRNVTADAEVVCLNATATSPANLLDACDLQQDTLNTDVAEFSGKPREGLQNLEAQTRKASSVVLSLDDVYTRGKISQVQAAIDDACAYAAKSAELVAADKLTYDKLTNEDGRDLGEDAKGLAAAIHSEFFPGDVVDPCVP